MPKFVVLFSEPVIDQPDHPHVARSVDQLPVTAPTPEQAYFHAARVTRGQGVPVGVYDMAGRRVSGEGPDQIEIHPPAAPVIESTPDIQQVFSV